MQAIGIHPIDNPVMHGSLQSADEFVSKQEEAVANLIVIKDRFPAFDTRLLTLVCKLDRWKISDLAVFLLRPAAPLLRRILCSWGQYPLLLDLYKVALYLHGQSVTRTQKQKGAIS